MKKRSDKQKEVQALRAELENTYNLFLTSFEKLTVAQDFELRKAIRAAGGNYRVVKNNLVEKAAEGTKAGELLKGLQGMTSLAYTSGDPVALAKALTAYAKTVPAFTFKAGMVEGRVVDVKAIEELATSINEYGILEPLIVQRIEKETPNGIDVEYQLIAGERRLRAAQFLGMKTVPVIIKDINSESLNLEIALVENIQREDLNPIAKAKSYMQLINKFGYTQEMVGKKVGKSRESIANTLRLLQLPFEAQKALEEGKITESHARAILLLPNMEKQRALLGEIISKQLSSREAEQISRQYLANYVPHKNENVRQRLGDSFNPQDLELREKLESVFDTKVSIKRKGDKGEIAIYFNSDDELENIVNKISKFSQKIIDQTAANL